jgi:hypothetical protein
MKQLLLDRILKAPPIQEYITPQSTPVVAFGNPMIAEVATLGINPSSREFLDAKGNLLTEENRRLADFRSLGIQNHAQMTSLHAEKVLENSNNYFKKDSTVYKWFEPLERFVLNTVGTSFRDSTATHLDLVQWSTAPVWGAIKDKTARELLIRDDIRFLGQMLGAGSYRVLFMNGSTVVNTMVKFGLVDIEQQGFTPLGKSGKTSALWTGRVRDTDTICLGWNLNLQHYQTTESNREHLRDWITSRVKGL